MAGQKVLIVGGGFAGFFCARWLEKHVPAGALDVTLVSQTDYLLYSPLLPEVASGVLEPRSIAVPLHRTLNRTRIVVGQVSAVDLDGRTAMVTTNDGSDHERQWDRIALTSGSVTRTFPIPGLAEHAVGLKTLAEAVHLRDRVLAQLDVADATDDPRVRRAATTFIVVGAGYAGTETTAQVQRLTRRALPRYPRLAPDGVRWMLVDVAPRVLPELGVHLGDHALTRLRARGVEVRLSTSVTEITPETVALSSGEVIDCRTLVWCAGVQPAPAVGATGLPVQKGRLVVGADLQVPDRPDVFAAGDAAAVPDLTKPGAVTPPTAQHAQRQGKALGRNIAASLGHGRPKPYRHHDLGLVADLGDRDAVARPVGVELTGLPAKAVARGYHLYALPTISGRVRTAVGWALDSLLPPSLARLDFTAGERGRIAVAERTALSVERSAGD